MYAFDEASEIVQREVRFLGSERVGLSIALNRILAEDLAADMDIPPFDKSAMDGYACRREDLGNELKVIETIPAGRSPKKRVAPNECSKIMTGAIVPEGADCVIRVEDTEQCGETAMRFRGCKTLDNICRRAEDISKGDTILRRGDMILPQHVAVLASVGCAQPLVARRPRVAVIPTGNELVEPDTMPGPSQIRNSNGYQLCAQTAAAGAVPVYCGIAADTAETLDAFVRRAGGENDVVVLSGGVSMGDFDLVPSVLEQNGVRLLFEKVAIKPGMPTVFGVSDDAFWFGLPGNPVSTFVIFELLVKPFLMGLMGHEFRPLVFQATLEKGVERRKAERDAWIPVQCAGPGTARAIDYHGSAHVNALMDADGLICLPRGIKEAGEGTVVDVRQI